MSDEIDRQKVEAWFDPPVKIPRPILDSMAADLAKATARADALAVENAELRATGDRMAELLEASPYGWDHDTAAMWRRLRGGRGPEGGA
jgi:hypothetical protein